MKSLQSREVGAFKKTGEYSEAGSGRAGIVDLGDGFGVFRIDAESCGDPRTGGKHFVTITVPLAQRIEDEVVRDLQHLGHLGGFVGRGEDVDLAAEFLVPEPCLVQSARGRADEVVAQQGVETEAGEGLLGEKDLRSGLVLDALEDGPVVTETGLVEDKTGCVEPAALEGGEEARDVAPVEAGFGMVGHDLKIIECVELCIRVDPC